MLLVADSIDQQQSFLVCAFGRSPCSSRLVWIGSGWSRTRKERRLVRIGTEERRKEARSGRESERHVELESDSCRTGQSFAQISAAPVPSLLGIEFCRAAQKFRVSLPRSARPRTRARCLPRHGFCRFSAAPYPSWSRQQTAYFLCRAGTGFLCFFCRRTVTIAVRELHNLYS